MRKITELKDIYGGRGETRPQTNLLRHFLKLFS